MEIMRGGSRASGTGSAEYFTGSVRQDPVVTAPEPARVRAVMVTFEPGARTAWHTHPLGQTLLVTITARTRAGSGAVTTGSCRTRPVK